MWGLYNFSIVPHRINSIVAILMRQSLWERFSSLDASSHEQGLHLVKVFLYLPRTLVVPCQVLMVHQVKCSCPAEAQLHTIYRHVSQQQTWIKKIAHWSGSSIPLLLRRRGWKISKTDSRQIGVRYLVIISLALQQVTLRHPLVIRFPLRSSDFRLGK